MIIMVIRMLLLLLIAQNNYKLDLKNTTVIPSILACQRIRDIAETLVLVLTSQQMASEKGYVVVVLKWGADPDIAHNNGQTALDTAHENKHRLVAE